MIPPLTTLGRTLVLAFAIAPPALYAAQLSETDICIYGGTSGGVSAAVQARRMGKSVILVEPGVHIGGLSSGGLGWTDSGNAAAIGGISSEFYTRIGQKYGQGGRRFTFEPHIAEEVFFEMLDDAGVPVVLNSRLAVVRKSGNRITEIETVSGDVFRAQMFIDTTYEGDLMAMAGVSSTLGRESNAQYGETLNGVRPGAQGHQFVVDVDPYLVPGNPASGLLPYVSGEPLAAPGTADDKIQAYNFRLCLTQNLNNFIPITAPLGYDAANYELLARYITARVNAGNSLNLRSFLKIDAMPNGKTDINNQGAFSTDFIGQNYDYPEGDYATRDAIWEATRNYINGLLHFLGTDPRVPVAIRDEMLSWGLCADEFQDTGGWPHAMYVREARRMVSDYVMTEHDARGNTLVPKPIALGSYTMDSHNLQRIVNASGFARNEGDVQTGVPQPYGIAYQSITPAVGECENLFVTFCLSASHIAFGSARMEPVLMITSQSAATAAALAIDDATTVQDVDYEKLAPILRADGQLLTWGDDGGIDPTEGTVVDNTDATAAGDWVASSASPGFYGSNYLHDNNAGQGTKSVTFTPNLPSAGEYNVYLRWAENANRASNAPVTIHHTGGTFTTTVNQQTNGAAWNLLGTFEFNAGTDGDLVIETTAADGYVIADAALWLAPSTVPTNPTVNLLTAVGSSAEGEMPEARLVFTRDGELSAPLTINYTVGGTATPGDDYFSLPGSFTIPANAGEAALSLTSNPDGLAEGDETVTLSIDPDAAYDLGATIAATLTIHDEPFDAWRATYFSAPQLLDPMVSGELANPDLDAGVNLIEFLGGGNPLVADTPPPTILRQQADGLYLELRRHRQASGLALGVENTPDLSDWQAAPATSAGLTFDTPYEWISWKIADSLAPGFEGFRIVASNDGFIPTGEDGILFHSFDTQTSGNGAFDPDPTIIRGFAETPSILRSGTVPLVGGAGGASSFTDPDGSTWLGSGASGTPGHCIGWNPGSSGNRLTITLNTLGQQDILLRMDIRSAAAAGGTPPNTFDSFTYNTGSGPQPVSGATLTFPADNSFHGWSADLSNLDAIENQATVILEWTFDDLAGTPSPIESFRIDNLLVTSDSL